MWSGKRVAQRETKVNWPWAYKLKTVGKQKHKKRREFQVEIPETSEPQVKTSECSPDLAIMRLLGTFARVLSRKWDCRD